MIISFCNTFSATFLLFCVCFLFVISMFKMPPKCSVEVLSGVPKHKVSYQMCVCVYEKCVCL